MVTHGGEAYNFVETESGWEVERKAIEKGRFGRDIVDMDRETIAHEYRIPSGTMNSYMSDRAPERLKELLTDQVLSDKDGWNEVAATQQYIAGAQFLNQMVGHKGEISTFADIKGQGNLIIEGGEGWIDIFEGLAGIDSSVKAVAGVDIGRKNREAMTYSLHFAMLSQIDQKARERATIGGKFDRELFEEFRHQGFTDYRKALENSAANKTELQFGADSIAGEAWESVKGMLNEARNIFDNFSPEERQKLQDMSPEERQKFIQEKLKSSDIGKGL